MKIAIVTCMWGRHRLVRRTLERLQWARVQLASDLDHPRELVTVVAGSEGADSQSIVEGAGAVYLETPNAPLSHKWNAAFARAREERPDVAIMIGSDDWTTPATIWTLATMAQTTAHGYVGVADMYMYDLRTGRACHWPGYTSAKRLHDSLGALRTLRADTLDRIDWRPFAAARDRALDWEMSGRLRDVGIAPPAIVDSHCLLDVKGAGNICDYDQIHPRTPVKPGELDRQFGAGTLAALEALR